jgi:hypothetical protein
LCAIEDAAKCNATILEAHRGEEFMAFSRISFLSERIDEGRFATAWSNVSVAHPLHL